jgi:sigma-54 dependent transcriptional regulator, acetoin dehydrogenase operon transcriptional activator AcoR
MRRPRNSIPEALEMSGFDATGEEAPAGSAERPRLPDLLPLAGAELERRREQDDAFWVALPVLQEFGAQLASSQSVLAFFDAGGCMLSLDGDPQTAARLAEIDVRPGASWREGSGPEGGVAPSGGPHPGGLSSGHLVGAGQSWWRSVAPVLAPRTGELLGTLDITAPQTVNRTQGLVLVRAIARVVEERLRAIRLVLD